MQSELNRPAMLAAAHGWAAIETAPKDGTKLLLWCGDEMEIGYWSTSLWVTRPTDSPLGKQDGAWIIYENRSDTIELNPTHWQPLPLPPNARLTDGDTRSRAAGGYARFHVHTTKLRGEPRVWWVHDGDANQWNYPNSEIVFGPCSRSKAEKECARLNKHNEKAEA